MERDKKCRNQQKSHAKFPTPRNSSLSEYEHNGLIDGIDQERIRHKPEDTEKERRDRHADFSEQIRSRHQNKKYDGRKQQKSHSDRFARHNGRSALFFILFFLVPSVTVQNNLSE